MTLSMRGRIEQVLSDEFGFPADLTDHLLDRMDEPRPHPNYPASLLADTARGMRCECGGILFWHAPPPYGCDDCICTEFRKDRP
jgi:hypothetical protein